MKKKFSCYADMGSMKILFNGGSAFFNNGIGDIDFKVTITDKQELTSKNLDETDFEFEGHFTSFGDCWLVQYDCSNESKLFKFPKGRWFVYRKKNSGDMLVELVDKEQHS